MEIYNENMERIENPDMTLGWLEDSTRTVHHDAVPGVTEQWHYEVAKVYPNGGKELKRVIDVPGAAAQKAWDEKITIKIYHPYTQEELDAMAEAENKPTQEERISALEEENKQLKEALELLLSGVTAEEGEADG